MLSPHPPDAPNGARRIELVRRRDGLDKVQSFRESRGINVSILVEGKVVDWHACVYRVDLLESQVFLELHDADQVDGGAGDVVEVVGGAFDHAVGVVEAGGGGDVADRGGVAVGDVATAQDEIQLTTLFGNQASFNVHIYICIFRCTHQANLVVYQQRQARCRGSRTDL